MGHSVLDYCQQGKPRFHDQTGWKYDLAIYRDSKILQGPGTFFGTYPVTS